MNLKTPLLIFRICKIIATIAVVAILLTGVYSMVLFFMPTDGGDGGNGDDEGGEGIGFISMPEGEEIDIDIDGGKITFSAPMEFHNNGLYPIEDFAIEMEMLYEGDQIFYGLNDIGTLPAGGSKEKDITYSTSIDDLVSRGLAEVLFNDLDTELSFNVRAAYLYNWFSFELGINMDQEWESPVNVSVDSDGMSTDVNPNGSVDVTLPLNIDSADWLHGSTVIGDIEVNAPSISSSPLSTVPLSIILGGNSEENLTFTLSPTDMNTLAVQDTNFEVTGDLVLDVDGSTVNYELDKEVPWIAPLRNVNVNVMRNGWDNSIDVNIDFENNRNEGRDFVVNVTLVSGTTPVIIQEEHAWVDQHGFYNFNRNILDDDPGLPIDGYICSIGYSGQGPLYAEVGSI